MPTFHGAQQPRPELTDQAHRPRPKERGASGRPGIRKDLRRCRPHRCPSSARAARTLWRAELCPAVSFECRSFNLS